MTESTPPAQPPAEPPKEPPAEPPKDPEPPKTLTQDEVNKLMAEEKRKAKAAQKSADDALAKLKELEDAKLSEEEKYKRDLEEREKKVVEAEAKVAHENAWRDRGVSGAKAGFPAGANEAIRAFVEADVDGREEAAKALLTAFVPTLPKGATPGGRGPPPTPASLDQQIADAQAEAMKTGDWRTYTALCMQKQTGV